MTGDQDSGSSGAEINVRAELRNLALSVANADVALLRAYTAARTAEHLKPARAYLIPGKWFLFSYYGPMTAFLHVVRPGRTSPDWQEVVPGQHVLLDARDSVVTIDDKREGLYFYLGTHIERDIDHHAALTFARDRLNEARGWVTAAFGEGLVETLLFENTLDLTNLNQAVSFNVTILGGDTLEALRDYDERHAKGLLQMLSSVENLPASDARLVRLAIRWYARSFAESPTDSFLTGFFALEALAKSAGSAKAVRGISQLLGSGYDLPVDVAREQFLVGRLQGIRDRIAHGNQEHVPEELVRYVRAVFLDALGARLGCPMPRGAMGFSGFRARRLVDPA